MVCTKYQSVVVSSYPDQPLNQNKSMCCVTQFSYEVLSCQLLNQSKSTCYGNHVIMGWLRSVGSIKLQVSFVKDPYKRDYILQKRLEICSILLTVAAPYQSVDVSTPQSEYVYVLCKSFQFHSVVVSSSQPLNQKRVLCYVPHVNLSHDRLFFEDESCHTCE